MKRLMLVALLLALPGKAIAQDIVFKPANTAVATDVSPGVTGTPGCTNEVLVADGSSVLDCASQTNATFRARRLAEWFTDLPGGGATGGVFPFQQNSLATGTVAVESLPARPGIWTVSCSTSANSGYAIWVAQFSGVSLGGGERFEVAFTPSRFTAVVSTAGFLDSITSAAIVDGAFLSIDATGLITGVTSSDSTTSTTDTSFQLVLGTWYRGVVSVSSTTSVTFTVYSAADVVLWTDDLTTNVPNGAGRETGAGVRLYHTGTGSVLELGKLDWIYTATGPLNR